MQICASTSVICAYPPALCPRFLARHNELPSSNAGAHPSYSGLASSLLGSAYTAQARAGHTADSPPSGLTLTQASWDSPRRVCAPCHMPASSGLTLRCCSLAARVRLRVRGAQRQGGPLHRHPPRMRAADRRSAKAGRRGPPVCARDHLKHTCQAWWLSARIRLCDA